MRPSEPLSEGRRPSPSPSPVEQPLVEEFQFLRCQNCQAEAKCPKLLPCLHSLCSACLQENSLQCPFCKVPGPPGAEPPALDNVFFESLQRHLALHRQVVDQNAACTRCKSTASFWCPQCEQLLCMQCYEAHRYYLKHETQRLENLQQWPVHEFLDSLRKTNNIFCNRSHPEPMLTNIYCRGCAKALCCSCAILDEGHKDLRCDIRNEVEQRQQELDAMTQVLGEHEAAFGDAQAQMLSAVSRLDQLREDTEELVRARIRQLLAFVRERERELLQAVAQRHQQDHDEMAGRLQRLDAVLQRIRTGSELVRSMKRLASDQEVLDMHDFLRQALLRLRQELPQSPEAAVSIDGFDEVKARLQDLVSRVTQGTDLPEPESTSPVVTSTPQTCSDVDLVVELQAPDPAQTQTEAVVPSMPGVHPVPMHAYSIQGPLCREEENPPLAMPQKRKFCQTESPRKLVKLSPEEENAEVLEPRPSTSKAVSPPCSEGTPSPRSTPVEDKDSVPQNNHLADDPKEAGPAAESPAKQLTCSSQRATPEPDCFPPLPTTQGSIVVISSSDDSDTENSASRDLDESSNESSDVQLEGPSSLRAVEEALTDPQAEDRPLVFFDLRIDPETQKISQLAAVNGDSKFRALIGTEASLSVYSKSVSLKVGLEHFLCFLSTMPRPVLACHKLWGPNLPLLFHALEDLNQMWALREVTSGFLATLPLLRERLPEAGSLQLKSLARTYLARNVNESSALASVLTMRDLCRLLQVSPGPQLAPHIYSFSSLHCFASLQPLVRAAVLPRPDARLLALHNVDFTELCRAHQRDPQGGLKKYGYYLSLPDSQDGPSQPASILQALSSYLGALPQSPASVKVDTPMPGSGHSSNMVDKTPQQR